MDDDPLLEVKDFDDKLAKVKVYGNRIERGRKNYRLGRGSKYDIETIPVRSITGVSAERKGTNPL